MKAMEYTKEQIQKLWKESVKRQDALEAEYRRIHGLTLSVSVSTPEIIAEEVEQNRLFHEYKEAYRRDEKEYRECYRSRAAEMDDREIKQALEENQRLHSACIRRRDAYVAEYKRTHYIPSRCRITTPEIIEEEELDRRLIMEYFALFNEQKKRVEAPNL
mgnify:FL=1